MQNQGNNERISINVLTDLRGADKAAKAYAFLYAAFRKTEVSQNPVRDALDCITPFITPYLNQIAGKQIDVQAVQNFLRTTIGFDIPLYALEQVIPSLAKAGLAEYHPAARLYFAKKTDASFDIVKSEIETDFDQVEQQLSRFAVSLGLDKTPASPSWGDALISFLKSRSEPTPTTVSKIKGALLDPAQVEHAVVGAFIRNLHETQYATFEKLLRIFMGVLVEDFVSSVAEIGTFGKGEPLNIFYDTGVLLRVMGCSGKLLRSATEELTRYLQDLGCRISYLAGNEAEVANILNTIVYVKDSGGELEGETAEAVSNGEISITDLRMLQNSFPERLARMNIFPAEEFEKNVQALTQFQIDEKAFSEYLLKQANKSKRAYGVQNRTNDAGFLGAVMRLRRNIKTRDLAECRFLFITVNKFLATTARHFLMETKQLQPQFCPPMLSVGQVATIAWLMKDQVLAPEKAGRELLSHCFAAIRPDAEWFRFFREGMEKLVGPLDAYASETSNSLALQAARRIAQEESFGSSSLVRELNMVEILSRAKEQADGLIAEKELAAKAAEQAAKAEAEHAITRVYDAARTELNNVMIAKEAAVEEAARAARQTLSREIEESNRRRAHRLAHIGVLWLKATSTLAFLAVFVADILLRESSSFFFHALEVVLGIIAVASFVHLIGIPVGEKPFGKLEEKLALLLLRMFRNDA